MGVLLDTAGGYFSAARFGCGASTGGVGKPQGWYLIGLPQLLPLAGKRPGVADVEKLIDLREEVWCGSAPLHADPLDDSVT
ncbi:hypothetical protein GCM10023317_72820 [Actinopolymorpha pittospori]